MTKNIALSRPAMSAIAAFLALSTTSAYAQEAPTITMTPPVAAPAPQTPPTVAEPSAPAPVAAPQAAAPTAAAPIIRVPLDIAPVETTPTPRAAESAAAPVRAQRAAPRTIERARPAAAVAAAPVAASPIAEAAPVDAVTPMAAPAMAPVETAAQEAAPPPVATTTAPAGEFPWEIAGGAAALLIVGGAGLAFARRRRTDRSAFDEAPTYEAPTYEASHVREAVVTADPATGESQPWITPAYAPRDQAAPAARTTPAFAAAPSGSMGRHEAMAMAGPTPENPFVTLNKRLKRARFLDRQERVAYDNALGQQKDVTRTPVSAWEIAQRPAPAIQEQDVRRVEPARPRTTTTFRPGYSNS